MPAPIAAAAVGIGGMVAGGMMANNANLKTATRDYRSELLSNLDAQGAAIPVALGIESEYGPQVASLRTSLIENQGPQYVRAMQKATGTQGIMDQLLSQAGSELSAGGLSLDPAMAAELRQNIRSGQAARGFGWGLSDIGAETALTAGALEELRRNRQGFAGNVVRLAGETAGGPASIYGAVVPNQLTNAESPYAANIYDANQRALQARYQASYDKKMALAGSLMNMGGSLMGAGLGGMGGGGAGLGSTGGW